MDAVAIGLPQSTPFESISLPATPTATENRSHCLPENGFFLAVMSVYWSNLVGPRIEQVMARQTLLVFPKSMTPGKRRRGLCPLM